MGRRPCCEKVGLKKGRWTAEEDEILAKYIKTHGEGSWRSLPKNAGLLRCGKSCRLRWINYLRSDLKRGNISADEEDMIVKLHAALGNRWSLIAGHLPGRTDNEIKNYWNSHLCRNIHVFRRAANSKALPFAVDTTIIVKRRGGKSRTQATRKNNSSKSEASSILSINETVIKDVPLPSTKELEREAFMGINVGENNCEKDIYGRPFARSCGDGERESEASMQKVTQMVEEPCGSTINGGVLGFNDLFQSGSMEITEWYSVMAEDREISKSLEERESGNYSQNEKPRTEEEEEAHRSVNHGVWQSLFSSTSSFDDSEMWKWQDLVDLVQVEELDDEITILPSLWVEDDVEQRNLFSWLNS